MSNMSGISWISDIAGKISKKCHVSRKVAAKEFVPMLERLFKDVHRAARLSSYFGFDTKDIEYFDEDNSKKIHEVAEKLTEEKHTQFRCHSSKT